MTIAYWIGNKGVNMFWRYGCRESAFLQLLSVTIYYL